MDADLTSLVVGAVTSAVLVAALTPLARRVWLRHGRREANLSLRKVHTGEIPRVGGAVMLVVICLVAGWGLAGHTDLSRTHLVLSVSPLSGVLAGALVCGLAGLWDDLFGLRARWKILAQVVAVAVALGLGVTWDAVDALFDRNWASIIITASFVVAAVNAINLIDGLDGLAGGVVAIGFLTIVGATFEGTTDMAVGWIAAVALGGVVGFLVHNRHPASVFMGDSGAYFLGFLLAGLLLFVDSVRPRKAVVNMSMPLLVLALPLLDMGLAVIRRAVRGQSIFSADADHVHHRLMARGLSHWQSVAILWAVSGLFSLMAYLSVLGVGGALTLAGALVTSTIIPVLLGYHRVLLPGTGAGDEMLPWQERRRETRGVGQRIDALATAFRSADADERWVACTPELQRILASMGVGAFQVRLGADVVARAGDETAVRAWLDLPLADGAELRLAFGGALVSALRPEQQHLLDRLVGALSDRGAAPVPSAAPYSK